MAQKIRRIEARCPVCKQWSQIDREELGLDVTCPNCRQAVKLVPRSSAARGWRNFLKVLIVLGGVALCLWMYSCREEYMTRSMGGVPLPDASTPKR